MRVATSGCMLCALVAFLWLLMHLCTQIILHTNGLRLRDTTGRYIQFGFDDLVPTRKLPHSDGRKKGKVL